MALRRKPIGVYFNSLKTGNLQVWIHPHLKVSAFRNLLFDGHGPSPELYENSGQANIRTNFSRSH